MPDHIGELFQEPIGKASGHRQFMVALESLDRSGSRLVKHSRRSDLTVAEGGEDVLHRYDAQRRADGRPYQVADRIIAPRGDRLQPALGEHIVRGRRYGRFCRICRDVRPDSRSLRRRRGIGEERRRLRIRLQKNGVDDDDKARSYRSENCHGIDRPMRRP